MVFITGQDDDADTGRLLEGIIESEDKLYPKEKALIDLVAAECMAGRRVLVYVTHTGTRDITGRMDDILTRHGFRVAVMKADAAAPDRREAWVADRVEEGVDVLICHPRLVQTGLDLMALPTIAWYETEDSVLKCPRQGTSRSLPPYLILVQSAAGAMGKFGSGVAPALGVFAAMAVTVAAVSCGDPERSEPVAAILSPTSTPPLTPTPTPTHTPTPTATPAAEEIILNTPVEMPRAMLFAAYTWPVRAAVDEIVVSITSHNDVELRGSHGLYFIACTAFSIGRDAAYFGLQTDVRDPARGNLGKGAIFSRWYEDNETAEARLADTRIPERGWTESGDYEGDFVSVRGRYQWGAGDYALKVAAQESDAVGRWYGLWVIDGNGEETWIGSLRFSPGARIDPVCYSTIEVYGGPPLKPANVPYWRVSVNPPAGNGIPADLMYTFYPKNVEGLRNALITVDGERVTFEVGLDYIAHD